MTKAVSPGKAAEPVADPQLPESARKLLREAEKHPHRYSGCRRSPWRAAAPEAVRGSVVAAGVTLLWRATGADQTQKPPDDLPAASLSDALHETAGNMLEALHSGIELLWPLAVTGLAVLIAFRVMETVTYNAALRVPCRAPSRRPDGQRCTVTVDSVNREKAGPPRGAHSAGRPDSRRGIEALGLVDESLPGGKALVGELNGVTVTVDQVLA
ncbi:hypothetical protein ACFFSH_31100 [Streptomyces filamentosus]|uniref:hypothetical protein n=1 Tax=Streptomyces filamentosus TaxID=67294 RepID=UPI001676BD8F|nr:hypothetical protein [Streptomyces filamentosus]